MKPLIRLQKADFDFPQEGRPGAVCFSMFFGC